jgi:hypothetical protein
MFVHSVYFWLKAGLSTQQTETFWEGVKSLTDIESVRQAYIGVPAHTDRPIIDRSYSCALIAVFDDHEAHDLYQAHEIHDRFRDECSSLWERVLIYDALDRA